MNRSFVYAPPGDRDALIRGPLGMQLASLGFRGCWSNIERGWWVRADRVSDLLSAAGEARIRVQFCDYRAPRPRPRKAAP